MAPHVVTGWSDALVASCARAGRTLDVARIEQAATFAEQVHEGQRRHSGEPYVTHCLAVAQLCGELGLDETSIVAALLHDTIEDTPVSHEDIAAQFGEEVAAIVEGVTKLTRIDFPSQLDKQAENYRKLIVAMADDIRVVLVKLADRLHNMRTIEFHRKDKRILKARETLEVYAPIAHRLGIATWKAELEDLSFAAIWPTRYAEIDQLVRRQKEDRAAEVERAIATLREVLADQGIEDCDISGRSKHLYSIYEKMLRRGIEFNEVYDLTAIRILCADVRSCYAIIGATHATWKPLPGRFKDYIAMPKPNGYRSLHTTVVGPTGTPLEVQVRTRDMHAEAELGIAAHWRYKSGTQPTERWAERIADWQRETPGSDEFLEALKADLADDQVFVFTPRGDVIALPVGATPIDFAYEVHTEIGNHTVGAKVHGRIVPLTTTLHTGDIVEILTGRNASPSRDWLEIAASTRAKAKIRQTLRQAERRDDEASGRDAVGQAARKAGIFAKQAYPQALAQAAKDIGYSKVEAAYRAVGAGKITATLLVRKAGAVLRSRETPAAAVEARPAPPSRRRTPAADVGVVVEGFDDILTRLARCCGPLPGDPVLGYISFASGVTVHRADCPNALALQRRHPERIVVCGWAGAAQRGFLVDVRLVGDDRTRLLEDISSTIAEHGANIVSGSVQTVSGRVDNRFTIDVADAGSFERLLADLAALDGVTRAERCTNAAARSADVHASQ